MTEAATAGITAADVKATTSRLVARRDLSGHELSAMHELLACYFDGVSARQFRRDAAEKNRAVPLERGGRLVGFTTLLAYEAEVGGGPVSVIYSGDNIVAPEAWNTSALPHAWIESVAALRRQEQVLARLVRRNADTAYGRQHGFGGIRTPQEFARRVPPVGYDELRPWIDRIRLGEPGVLTA